MNQVANYSRPLMWSVALLLSVLIAGCGNGDGNGGNGLNFVGRPTTPGAGTGAGGAGRGPAPVVMGTAGNFRILAKAAITDVPASAITGDVGLSPASGAAIGLTCPEVTGTIYSPDAAGPLPCRVTDATRLTTAVTDAGTAYTDANSRAPDYTELGAGNIGGLNLGPGTYKWGTGVQIPSNLTLTGGPNDVWIFQIAQGLSVSSGVQVILAGGALPQNIYWATFAASDLATTSKFKGTIISQTTIAMKTGATINGRLFSATDVTLQQNTVGP